MQVKIYAYIKKKPLNKMHKNEKVLHIMHKSCIIMQSKQDDE